MTTMSHADSGAATAEFAVVLPAVAMVAMVLLCLTRTVTVSIRCQDAASALVRELVTREGGLSGAGMSVNAVASGIAGEGAVVSVADDGHSIRVTAQCPVLPDPFGVLPVKVTGSATGWR